MERLNIVLISPEKWGTNFVSKHHYASLLAALGHEVLFVNPPSPRLTAGKSELNKKTKHLTTCDYCVLKGMNRLPEFFRRSLQTKYASSIVHQWSFDPDILWNFDPYQFQDLSVFPGQAFSIYHPVDVHRTMLERLSVEKADLIIGTSDLILKRFVGLRGGVRRKINHGLAQWFLESVEASVLPGSFKINIGLVGNLSYPYMDEGVLLKIVDAHKDIGFHFIGPDGRSNLGDSESELVDKLKNYSNVVLHGQVDSHELPSRLKSFDMFLITYQGDTFKTELANPHKLLEYLSTGKVVVSHYIDEYRTKEDLVVMSERNSGLHSKFKEVLDNLAYYNSEDLMEKRKKFSTENTYEQHLDTILSLVSELKSKDKPSA